MYLDNKLDIMVFMKNDVNLRRLHALVHGAHSLSSLEKLLLLVMIDSGSELTACHLSVNELGWFTNSNAQSVVRVLARLREAGLIETSPNPSDARRNIYEVRDLHKLDVFGFRKL